MIKSLRSRKVFSLILSMLVLAVPASFAAKAAKVSAMSGLSASSGIKLETISVPAIVEAAAAQPESRKGHNSGGNHQANGNNQPAAVYPPSELLSNIKSFSPTVDDKKRNTKMIEVLNKIFKGEKPDFSKDGTVFSNYQHAMPDHEYGYYREYTLLVPGRKTGDPAEQITIGGKEYTAGPVLSTRGAERLIIGGGKTIYYTPDHYQTFIELSPVR